MSSFLENAAGAEIQHSPAQNSVNFAYGSANDGASVVHAPPLSMRAPPLNSLEPVQVPVPVSVYQPERVVVSAPAPAMTAAEVVNQFAAADLKSNGNGDGSNGSAAKRRRGRPRKYVPVSDGKVVAASPVSSIAVQSQSGGGSVGGGGGFAVAQGGSGKRGRGRPAGSRGKHKDSSVFPFNVSPTVSGLAGVGFTPHIVVVQPGMDVLARLMSFSQVNSQAVCVLSANGTIASVTLQQSSSGGTVSYEGRFQILSISGSFLLSESGGQRSRTGGLSVSLAGPDGSVLGGGVAGLLIAASPVQVIVGTFMAASQQATRPGYNDTATPKRVSSVGGSPPSRATLSESSGGPVSPFNNSTGGCNNSNQQNVPNVAWS